MGVLTYQCAEPAIDIVIESTHGQKCSVKQVTGVVEKPYCARKRMSEFTVLRGLATEKEVREILRIGQGVLEDRVQRGQSRHTDSVDGFPTFEWHPMSHGNYDVSLEHVLRPILEQRLTPYVRQRYSAFGATPCTCLFRRYIEEERRVHPVHFDHQSFVTIVLGLNPGEFEGGLFVQGDLSRDRHYIDLGRGDACVHQYDLHHGVHVSAGTRFSLILWYMDTREACVWNTRLWYRAEAEAGDPDAMYNWGACLEEGDGSGLLADFESAFRWYTRAAELDCVHALNNLGKCFWEGRPGIAPCAATAEKYWSRAALLGYSKALSNLGGLYLCGSECPNGGGRLRCDRFEGIRMLKLAADKGDLDALFKLGCHGRAYGKSELVTYLIQAAEFGHPNACAFVAEMCCTKDLDIGYDLSARVRFTRWAAHLGIAKSRNNLGCMHCTGEGVEFDGSRAVQLFRLSAEQGDPDGQMNLALCYQRGIGVDIDAHEAYIWCEKASAQGQAMAMSLLAEFKSATEVQSNLYLKRPIANYDCCVQGGSCTNALAREADSHMDSLPLVFESVD